MEHDRSGTSKRCGLDIPYFLEYVLILKAKCYAKAPLELTFLIPHFLQWGYKESRPVSDATLRKTF